ncbi:MAG: YfiR family protein [Candidatus Solibacter usitatus]|nr:YfiR family protein [Candidatus Solibacter usitatus]
MWNRRAIKIALMWVIPALSIAAGVSSVSAQPAMESSLKAAFLYNLVKFVEWPGGKPGGKPEAITVGLVGKNDFGTALEQLFQGKELDGRALAVRNISKLEELKLCNLVFIAASEQERVGELLGALRGVPALTVSEIARFAQRGGMIQVEMDGRKIRFEVDAERVAGARLKISARFLQLASAVYGHDKARRQ